MAIAAISGVTASALNAYRSVQQTGVDSDAFASVAPTAATSGGADFGNMVQSALKGAIDQSHSAETQSTQAISGHGNLLDVVSAVSKAELSLQTTLAVRDRVVSAYQEIMRMSI